MADAPHLVVTVDKVDHVGDDGIARVLGRLAHHAKVQVAQVASTGRQQVACTCTRAPKKTLNSLS